MIQYCKDIYLLLHSSLKLQDYYKWINDIINSVTSSLNGEVVYFFNFIFPHLMALNLFRHNFVNFESIVSKNETWADKILGWDEYNNTIIITWEINREIHIL